jgi:hypothetical protein
LFRPLRPAGVQPEYALSLLQIKRLQKKVAKIEPAAEKSRVAKGQLCAEEKAPVKSALTFDAFVLVLSGRRSNGIVSFCKWHGKSQRVAKDTCIGLLHST